MIRISRLFLSTCFASLLSFNALAEAPVVDDSENFALLEEQQTTEQPSAAQNYTETNSNYDDTQPALARDTTDELSTPKNGNVDLVNKLQGLQQDIQELRGQLEMQAHELKLLQEQQLTFYKDLDARLRGESPLKPMKPEPTSDLNIDQKLPETNDPGKTPSLPSAQPVMPQASTNTTSQPIQPVLTTSKANTNPADEQISYLAAYELVKNKRFDEARAAMQTFVTKYPQGGYTANAQYWLGELYLVKKDYNNAMSHFDIVIQQFPTSSKYSASLLKMGYALADSGRVGEAKERLHEVVKKYPDTNTAELAHLKLETLGG